MEGLKSEADLQSSGSGVIEKSLWSIQILRSEFWKSQVVSDSVNEVLPDARSASRIFAVVAELKLEHISHLLHSVRDSPIECLPAGPPTLRAVGRALFLAGLRHGRRLLKLAERSVPRHWGLGDWLEIDSDRSRHHTSLRFARNRYVRRTACRSSATPWLNLRTSRAIVSCDRGGRIPPKRDCRPTGML